MGEHTHSVAVKGGNSWGEFDAFARRALLVSRWVLLVVAILAAAVLPATGSRAPHAAVAAALLLAYLGTTLVASYRIILQRGPVALLLALDTSAVAFVAFHTGGYASPFLGLFFLLVLGGAMFFGLPGGLLLGTASALLSGAMAIRNPRGAAMILEHMVPYFVILGAFTGYMSDVARQWFQRYRQSAAREEAHRLEAEVVRREMNLARAIQRAAIPREIPLRPGLSIAARAREAREVSGDLYLVLSKGDRTLIALGDVSGKGISAALVSTTIAYLLPSLLLHHDPDGAIRALNRELATRLPAETFVTFFLAEVDPGANRLCVWNAGHPPGFLWRAEAETIQPLGTSGLFLGMFEAWNGRPQEYPFQEGDTFVIYSDGLTETRNAAGELFGEARIAAALPGLASDSPEEVAAALCRSAEEWGEIVDDTTVVVCHRETWHPEDDAKAEANTETAMEWEPDPFPYRR